jgi:iron-sulfur cluster repair protein YtfE (RIC family)
MVGPGERLAIVVMPALLHPARARCGPICNAHPARTGVIDMSIYERLKADHDRQRDLAARIVETAGDSKERRELWQAFKVELEAHASAEEQSFYAGLMQAPAASDQARHSVTEHKEMADLCEEIDEIDMSSGAWLTRFKKLKDDVEHHLDEEEADVFPLARENMSAETEKAIEAYFVERKPAEVERERAKDD